MKTMSRSIAILFVLSSDLVACGSAADVADDVSNEEFGAAASALVRNEVSLPSGGLSPPDTQRYKNAATDRCMRDGPDHGLHSGRCEGGAHLWLLDHTGSGVQLKNVLTGACIHDSASYGLDAIRCHDDKNPDWEHQLWMFNRAANGAIRFRNVATGWCIKDRGGNLVHAVCSTENDQRFE